MHTRWHVTEHAPTRSAMDRRPGAIRILRAEHWRMSPIGVDVAVVVVVVVDLDGDGDVEVVATFDAAQIIFVSIATTPSSSLPPRW